jgi:hypothetical protein
MSGNDTSPQSSLVLDSGCVRQAAALRSRNAGGAIHRVESPPAGWMRDLVEPTACRMSRRISNYSTRCRRV